MIPLIACIVWLGVYPAPVLRRMENAATKFVTRVNGSGAAVQPVAEARQ
jgi:NADH:ubiquinone oxidoreductase subunit 4 (subunit M)